MSETIHGLSEVASPLSLLRLTDDCLDHKLVLKVTDRPAVQGFTLFPAYKVKMKEDVSKMCM